MGLLVRLGDHQGAERGVMNNVAARMRVMVAHWMVVLVLGAMSVWPSAASAATSYLDAMNQCQALSVTRVAQAKANGYTNYKWQCVLQMNTPTQGNNRVAYMESYTGGTLTVSQVFNFTGPPPPDNPCTVNAPNMTGSFAGKITSGMSWCKAGVDTGRGDGSTVSCTMTFTPSGSPPTANQWGSWHTTGTLAASGDTCDGTGGGEWKTSGGAKPSPLPDSPATSPPVTNPPQACGGGSCYDAANDQYCAVAGGAQVCVSGTQARSAGGCASMGDATLCAGSPAPIPTAPPVSPISDPGTQIKSSDTWTQADATTGANKVITVNTYGAGATTPTSGQNAGDSGPAPASSSGGPKGDGTTSSGGGDCNTPPIVNGSGGLSAVAYQTWATRCALQGSKGGTGDSVGTLYTPSGDTAQSVVAGFQAQVQGAPIAGAVSGFFSVGGGGGACPTWTLAATDWNPELTFDFYCRPEADEMLDMARVVVLILCAYVAFQIAMGDS